MTLLVSNHPLAPRQRLAESANPPRPGAVWLAGADGLVVGRGRIAGAANGWLELEGIEEVQPFHLRDERETVLAWSPGGPARETAVRPEQRRFRDRLMREYAGRCAVTGCDVAALLDAAHLRPWRIDDKEGVLLRTDLHRMIDRGLAEIRNGRFRLARPVPAYLKAAYGGYDGARLQKPRAGRR